MLPSSDGTIKKNVLGRGDTYDSEWREFEDFAQTMSETYRRIEEARQDIRWSLVRPRTSWDFIDFGNVDPINPLFDQGLNKENQLVEDLINCFMGFHGTYITAERLDNPNSSREFKISDCITGVSRGMARRLLPLASYYSRVVRYVQSGLDLSAGRVNQALSGFLQEKTIRFTQMVVQLDERHSVSPLDLNQMNLYLQGTMSSMKTLHDLVCSVHDVRGGETLSALHDFFNKSMIGSPTRKLIFQAISAASEPYFQSVTMWIYKGILYDPFDEFMIVQKGNENNSANWDVMFCIREKEVPVFLKNQQTFIHKAGKYLDAVRRSLSCTEDMPHCQEKILRYDINEDNYCQIIKEAFNFANQTLYKLVMYEFDVIDRIKTAKSFLCLEGGDLFHNLIDNCLEELDRPPFEVCVSYLPSLVNSSVESSSLYGLKHCDQMVLYMEKETLPWQVYNLHAYENKLGECFEEQSGLEALTFKIKAAWPVSLILHERAVKCYQMLFRHLFHLKMVHFKLVRASHKGRPLTTRQHYLKHIMTVFLQSCIFYMTVGTIELHWHEFLSAVDESKSVEDVRHAHDTMLYKCLQGCMLVSPKLFRKFRKTLDICSMFADDVGLAVENSFVASVSSLVNVALQERPLYGLENFAKEIIPIFQYDAVFNLNTYQNISVTNI